MYEFVTGLLDPVFFLFVIAATALALLGRKRVLSRRGLIWAAAGLVALAALCTRGAAYFALGSLEWQYPPEPNRPDAVGAIVVLACNLSPPDALLPKGELGDRTLYRCLHAARLYHQGARCPVVACGGPMEPGSPSAAAMMRDFLLDEGVAPSDVVLEDRSRTTFEDAVETRRLLWGRGIDRIVLVTDAVHMPRAVQCFSAQGFEVTASGCYYRATRFPGKVRDFLPSAGAAEQWTQVLHEWLGLAWYWLRGRSSL